MDLILLGAINKNTNLYENPNMANKKNIYVCPDCNKNVIVKKGNIKKHHFAHQISNQCTYYTHPTESQIHKDAKLLMAYLLTKKDIVFTRICKCCKNTYNILYHAFDDTNVVLEHRFTFCDKAKIADVAVIDKLKNILFLVEVYYTHKTDENDRPEPWVEINAQDLINIECNDNVTIKCDRQTLCNICRNEKKQLDESNRKKITSYFKNECLNKHCQEKINEDIQKINNDKINEDTQKISNEKFIYISYADEQIINNKRLNRNDKCVMYVQNIIDEFKLVIDAQHKFEQKYHDFYYEALMQLYNIGSRWQHGKIYFTEYCKQNGFGWQFWDGEKTISHGINKNILKKFMKYFNLLNPVTIEKNIYELFGKGYFGGNIASTINKRKCYFNVKYNQKEDFKEMGGLWDVENKKWYAYENNKNLNNMKVIYNIIE